MTEPFEINGRYFRYTAGGKLVAVVPGTIHLQGVGDVPARPASEITVGTRLMWNTGAIYTVVAVRPNASGKTLAIDERDDKTGKVYTGRRLNTDRLVAIV